MKHSAVNVKKRERGFLEFIVVCALHVGGMHVCALHASEQHVDNGDTSFDSLVASSIDSHALVFNASIKELLDSQSKRTTFCDALADEIPELVNDASLPILFRGDLSPANAAYSINRPGVYKLTSAKTASGVPNISITANNVTLDLGGNVLTGGTNGIEIFGNNVTVKNGTITGMTGNGVFVQGTGCRIDDLAVAQCATGITLQSCNQCVIDACSVRDATQAGISLQRTWMSSVRACTIESIRGAASVYGVLAQNGGGNSVEECSICDLRTHSSMLGAEVGGIVLLNETRSYAVNNKIEGVVSSAENVGTYGVAQFVGMGNAAKISDFPLVNGQQPQVAFDSVGNAFAIWSQSEGSFLQIFFSRYTVGGSWSNPTKIPAQSIRSGNNPKIAFDQADNAIALWQQHDGTRDQIYFSRYTAGGSWSNAAKIPLQQATIARDPNLSIDRNGNALVVWWQVDGGINQIYWSRYTAGGSWTNAAKIPGQEPYDVFTFPRIAIDSLGNAFAVWIQQTATQGGRTFYSRYTIGGGWSNATRIEENMTFSAAFNPPEIAFDYANNAILVWVQTDQNGRSGQIYYSRYTSGGSWSNPAKISAHFVDPGIGPQVAFDSYGNAFAVWSQRNNSIYQPYYSRYTAGDTWSDAVKIPGQVLQNGWALRVAFDSVGNAFVVWYQFDGLRDQVYYSRYTAGGSWSNAAKILEQPLFSGTELNPQVAFDSSGNAFMVWKQNDGSTNQIYVARSTEGVGMIRKNYSAAVTKSDNGEGIGFFIPNYFVEQNTAYDCDLSFVGVSSEYITSQANARGTYNIDTNLTTPDSVPLIIPQALTVESKLDSLFPEVATIESKIDYLMACDYDALPAPTTLSTNYGAYCLSADMAGNILITGTGITLCLNGHTITGGTNGIVVSGDEAVIKNGTVRNASASGIKITGDKCLLEDITSLGNVTGFELNGADNTVLKSCTALNNTREGFLLSDAQKNSFESCEAINTSGAGTVAGFKTTNGVGNRFVECKVNGVTSSNEQAYGILGYHETASEIADSTAMNIAASMYAAGIGLIGDYLLTPTVQDFVKNEARTSLSIDWLNTPVGSYIATESDVGGSIRVNLLDPTSGISSTEYTSVAFNIYGRRARWLTWNGSYYVAMSGIHAAAGGKIYVYLFSPVTGLSAAVTNYTDGFGVGCQGLAWVISGNIPYLFYTRQTGGSTAEFVCLQFNGISLTLRPPYVYYTADFPTNIDPHLVNGTWKLAVTGVTGTDVAELVRIYTFDDPQGSASLRLTTSYDTVTTGSVTYSGSWLDYDGAVYYAFGINNNASTPTVRVLKYTDSPESLTEFATYNYNAAAQSVDFLVTGTTVYLAVSGDKANARVEILKFDPYQGSITTRLSSYYICSQENQAGTEIRWNRVAGADNRVYLGVAKAGTALEPYLRVYGFDINDRSELNLVSDNVVSGVPGSDGLLVDPAVNSVYNTTAYNCTTGLQQGVRTSYSPLQPFDTSNRAVPKR